MEGYAATQDYADTATDSDPDVATDSDSDPDFAADSDFIDRWDSQAEGLPVEFQPAPRDTCMWKQDCRSRRSGSACAFNCLWQHKRGASEPQCYGYFCGAHVIPRGHPDAALARRHCAACGIAADCRIRTRRRFGED